MRSLDHRNIVSYLGTSMESGAVYIFMEYISGGSIQSLVRRLVYCVKILEYTNEYVMM